jgi:flagellar protein FliT
MDSRDDILACYAELAGTLARMVELARERRWEPLPGLDAHCSQMFERLRGLDLEQLCALDRARVLSLASRIRADQDDLRALVRPQFQHLVRRMAQLQHAS